MDATQQVFVVRFFLCCLPKEMEYLQNIYTLKQSLYCLHMRLITALYTKVRKRKGRGDGLG